MSDSDDEIQNPQITPQSKPLEPASVMDFDLDLEASCSWPLDQIGFSSSSNPMSPFLISATSDHQPSSPLWVFSDVDDDRQAKLANASALSDVHRLLSCMAFWLNVFFFCCFHCSFQVGCLLTLVDL